MRIEELLSRLEKVKRVGDGQWIACCPAHQDRSPSLSIKMTSETILIHDFAGCSIAEILGAIGMTFEDLYPDHQRTVKPGKISARAALECMAEESLLVAASGATLRQRALTAAEMARLVKATSRIHAAWEMAR